jgi:hypothetical protein
LRSTGKGQKGNSLYTHLADGSGNSLATTSTYRHISYHDTSHYNFVATDESNDTLGSAGNTIIFHEGTLRLNNDQIGVKHGDIVRFLMLRSDDARTTGIGARSMSDIFSGAATVSGHIKVTGQVQYVDSDSSFSRIKILTQTNTSNWFNPNVGFRSSLGNIRSYETLRNRHWVGATHLTPGDPSLWYFKDSSISNVTGGASFMTPDDLYDIIADVSGLNCSAAGVSLTGADYKYPLDPRLIRWSQRQRQSGSVNLDGSGTVIMEVLTRSDTKESLCVALRDSSNGNLASTGVGITTYLTDRRSSFVPHILYLIDGTDHFPAPTGSGDSNQRLRDFLSNFVLPLTSALPENVRLNSRGTVVIFDTKSSEPGQGITAFVDNIGIDGTAGDDLPEKMRVNPPTAIDVINMGDYWSALSAFSQNRVGGLASPSLPQHNTVILISAYSNTTTTLEREDHGFDACFNRYYGNMRRIALSNYRSSDMINFTGGDSNNFFQLKENPGTRTQHQMDISAYAQLIAKQLTQSEFRGHNALAVHTADSEGHSQAATGPVKEATFGDVALYYSLSDACGSSISTYQTRVDGSNNALYVTLADGSGHSIKSDNGLYVAMNSKYIKSYGFDTSIGNKLVTLIDVSSINVDISVNGFNLNNLGLANESAVPVWVRVYDICTGIVSSKGLVLPNGDISANGLLPYLKYNFAIPATDYRDLQFSKPVLFNNGIYFAASTNFRYETLDYPPGRAPIYINGNYTHVSK